MSDEPGIQEQLIASLLSSLIPSSVEDDRAHKWQSKYGPDESQPLSLPTLTQNFRKFSSRIGIVFFLQNRVTSIYLWEYPNETLGYGMIWSLLCLQPHLLILSPFLIAIFCLLVPSFLV